METLPLFEDLFADEPELHNDPVNTADVAQKLYAIKKIEEEIDAFGAQQKEAVFFYKGKIESLEKRIDYLKGQLSTWLTVNGKQKLSTHNGTIFFQTMKNKIYPATEELIAWAKTTPRASDLVVMTELPALHEIQKYISESGSIPPGYMETEETVLRVRKA